ncbi:MAG: alpha/beta hydrolase, partial [Nitrospiria bacterium]
MQDAATRKDGTIQRGEIALSYASVIPASPKAALLIVHGINDHKGRYAELQDELAAAGFASLAYDQRGFGRSGGKRGDVVDYVDYHTDLGVGLRLLRETCPKRPVFLLGHSLGGLVAATYCIKNPDAVDALVLSSPAYQVPPLPFRMEFLGYVLNFLMPETAIGYPSRHHWRSHDPAVVKAVAEDPLIVIKATPRFYIQFRKMNRFLQEHADEIDMPTLILQAGDDKIVSGEGVRVLFERLKNPQKKLLWYEGFYHEV